MYARTALGNTSYWTGEFLPSREHGEKAISIYDLSATGRLLRYGSDVRVTCLSYAAWALWQLGYPDQALKRGDEALVLAQTLSHPISLAFSEFWFGVLRRFRREARAAQETAEALIALCAEHGFSRFLAYATTLRGWAMAEQGRKKEGIALIQEGAEVEERRKDRSVASFSP